MKGSEVNLKSVFFPLDFDLMTTFDLQITRTLNIYFNRKYDKHNFGIIVIDFVHTTSQSKEKLLGLQGQIKTKNYLITEARKMTKLECSSKSKRIFQVRNWTRDNDSIVLSFLAYLWQD